MPDLKDDYDHMKSGQRTMSVRANGSLLLRHIARHFTRVDCGTYIHNGRTLLSAPNTTMCLGLQYLRKRR